jgi:hypothetical protein
MTSPKRRIVAVGFSPLALPVLQQLEQLETKNRYSDRHFEFLVSRRLQKYNIYGFQPRFAVPV